MPIPTRSAPLTTREVYRTWLPLAASWLFMGLELPLVSAAIARLPDARHNLAAYGGVVFPLALLIESPVIMLLTASTALSRDERSYRVGRRVMEALGLTFTAVHALVAFSPLYDLVVRRALGVPAEIVEPARLGLRIMTPWTISIAYRRYQQGLLIRFGQARAVGIGTAVRLATNVVVLAGGLLLRTLPGIAVGTVAVTAGVVAEAIYAGLRAGPVCRGPLREATPVLPALTIGRFMRFYTPLMVTPLILFLASPLTSAAMSRMPRPLESLAAWPVITGLVFTLRSAGFALSEVVVAHLDDVGPWPTLRRFTVVLATATSALLLLATLTPAGAFWLARISALPPDLVALGTSALWLAVPIPALSAVQSLYQGALVHGHRTRAVSEAMLVYLVVTAVALGAGVRFGRLPGLHVALVTTALALLAHVAWLWLRASGLAVLEPTGPLPVATPPDAMEAIEASGPEASGPRAPLPTPRNP